MFEDIPLVNWAEEREVKKEEIPLVVNIPEDEIDTITGEKKPKQCEGCSS